MKPSIGLMKLGLSIAALSALGLLAMACGGGGGPAGDGKQITDPSDVPTSTPISGAQVYKIQGEGVVFTGAPGVTTTPSAVRSYTVQSGDTCAGIADKNGTTVAELLRVNRSVDANCGNLRVGEVLRLPSPPTATGGTTGGIPTGSTPRPGASHDYKVVAGDTCDGIARSQSTTLDKLLAANAGINCNALQVGQTVKIPGS